ncbi:MAG TPA: relaxase/mobilization nuclease domain-containing protein [Steroidobacteraceae bacterium]|nr:relaxase/mobilization nuclease domain-containing protein [Steroidobacteraceae bacterium]
MPMRLIEYEGRPLLDLSSYARKGPGRRDHLSTAEIELIGRTVNRVPEVMVKVLTRGGQNLGAVRGHLEYLDRHGDLEIETDDGQRIGGKGVERELLDDWDLDIEEDRRRATLEARPSRSPPKLVHKILFSMPPGTPPQKVLGAVKNFAREEFGLKHRYAMVLHTDEPHPHVHMVIKAVSEQGERLNIRKATLREWRRMFAEQLQREGVAANATERAARGGSRTHKRDGIYRAYLRGESTHIYDREQAVATAIRTGDPEPGDGKNTLRATRREVEAGWHKVSEILVAEGHSELAGEVKRFVRVMPVPMTEREQTAARIIGRGHGLYERSPPTR